MTAFIWQAEPHWLSKSGIAEHHASLEEIIAIAEKKFQHEFNSRLFTEQLLFMDDVRDYHIDFLKETITPADITAFFQDRIRELRLA